MRRLNMTTWFVAGLLMIGIPAVIGFIAGYLIGVSSGTFHG